MSFMNDEPKVAVRQRTFLKGTVYYDNRRASIECTIRDLSDSGARVTFEHPVTVPDHIELFIAHKQQTLRARVGGASRAKSALSSKSSARSIHVAPPTPSCRAASRRWKRKSKRSSGWWQSSRPKSCRRTST
jgi:hypothetical protein